MTTAISIGERVSAVCKVLEKTGPTGMTVLKKHFPELKPNNVFKYANRGLAIGLVTADDSGPRRIYEVREDWAEILKARTPDKVPAPRPRPQKYKGPILTRWVGAMSYLNEVRA